MKKLLVPKDEGLSQRFGSETLLSSMILYNASDVWVVPDSSNVTTKLFAGQSGSEVVKLDAIGNW